MIIADMLEKQLEKLAQTEMEQLLMLSALSRASEQVLNMRITKDGCVHKTDARLLAESLALVSISLAHASGECL